MLLEAKHINKSFHTKQVLNDINFAVDQGEIHGLVGKNGAGKSTFVNIVTGLLDGYDGQVFFNGENIDGDSVLQRQKKGLFLVPQHSSIVTEFSVAENIFIGVWPRRGGRVDWSHMYQVAARELGRYGLDVDPRTKTKKLSLVDQRKLNIVRALFSSAKLVILDEPTTSLTQEERDNLFSFILDLRSKGTSFIFISHYLDEVLRVCDNITVFKDGDGRLLSTEETHSELDLSRYIVGEDVALFQRSLEQPLKGEEGFGCEGLCAGAVQDVSFTIKRGEIVGFVGFPGSGARETLRALGGLNRIHSGTLRLEGDTEVVVRNPADALRGGLVYVPFDRHDEGLVQEMSILHNISLSLIRDRLCRAGLLRGKEELKLGRAYYDRLAIKAKSIREKVRTLSGGNQQKVLVAKALSCEPRLLMLDEPTIGIDIGSREEILSLVHDLSLTGIPVIYHTSDYSEMLRICDRVLFFSSSTVCREADNDGLLDVDKVAEIRDSLEGARAHGA